MMLQPGEKEAMGERKFARSHPEAYEKLLQERAENPEPDYDIIPRWMKDAWKKFWNSIFHNR